MDTPAEFFDKVNAAAKKNREAANAMDAILQFDISGDNGGIWVVDLRKSNTGDVVSREKNPDAAATVKVSDEDWVALIKGELDPMQAFMGGKLKLAGDMMFATQMQTWFGA